MITANIVREENTTWVDVDNGNGLQVRLSGMGAGVYQLVYKGVNMILTPQNATDYLTNHQFFGKTLGRVAGRIPADFQYGKSKFHLPVHKQGYCQHGGEEKSLSFKEWKPRIVETSGYVAVIFSYTSPDGECGFPGNLEAKVIYTFPVDDRNTFTLGFEAVADKDTPVSFSNHIYWDLESENDVSRQYLKMDADRFGTDDGVSQLVTGVGPILPVLDFRQGAFLGEKLDVIEKTLPVKNLDHTFLFTKVDADKVQVCLESAAVRLNLYTDFEAINVYVDSSLSPVAFVNGPDLKKKRRAIALEPQIFTFNRDHLILKAGEKYIHHITYAIEDK